MSNPALEKTYTATAISEKLNVHRSTLNNWIVKFKDYLPNVQVGRHTQYTEEALHRLSLIDEMRKEKKELEIIFKYFQATYTQIIEQNSTEENYSLVPVFSQIKEAIDLISADTAMISAKISELTDEQLNLKKEQEKLVEEQKKFVEKQEELNEQLQMVADLKKSYEEMSSTIDVMSKTQETMNEELKSKKKTPSWMFWKS